jgi:hypothetical protein
MQKNSRFGQRAYVEKEVPRDSIRVRTHLRRTNPPRTPRFDPSDVVDFTWRKAPRCADWSNEPPQPGLHPPPAGARPSNARFRELCPFRCNIRSNCRGRLRAAASQQPQGRGRLPSFRQAKGQSGFGAIPEVPGQSPRCSRHDWDARVTGRRRHGQSRIWRNFLGISSFSSLLPCPLLQGRRWPIRPPHRPVSGVGASWARPSALMPNDPCAGRPDQDRCTFDRSSLTEKAYD